MTPPLYLRPGQYDIVHKADGWYWFLLSIGTGDQFHSGPFATWAVAFADLVAYGGPLGLAFKEPT